MKQVSLADITFDQGLQLLVLRKQALDSGQIRRMPKEAMDKAYPLQAVGTQMLESVKEAGLVDDFKNSLSAGGNALQEGFDGVKGGVQNWWGNLDEPTKSTFRHGLAGAGLGAASGAGASLLGDGKHYGRNMLMGGVAGGAIGSGLGIMQNPEIADKIQKRIESIADPDAVDEPGDTPPGPSTGTASAPTAASSPTGFDAKGKADEINAMGIEDKTRAVDELESLESSQPAYQAAAQAAGTAGAAGYGYNKLQGIQRYDPETLARSILQDRGGKVNEEAVKQLFGQSAKKLRKLPFESVVDLIRKHPELSTHMLSGNLKNPGTVQNLLGELSDTAVKSVPGSASSGFRGLRRPFRLGGGLGLGVAGAYSLYDALNRHSSQQKDKAEASQILDWLRRSVTK